MQNIPGIALEKAQEQLKTVRISSVKKDEQQQLFADLFDQHSSKVEKELALSPVETKDKMLDTAPVASNEKESTANATNIEAPPKEETPEEDAMHGREERMTKEEFEEVRDDLEDTACPKRKSPNWKNGSRAKKASPGVSSFPWSRTKCQT